MSNWEIPQGTTPATQRLWGVIGELDSFVHGADPTHPHDLTEIITTSEPGERGLIRQELGFFLDNDETVLPYLMNAIETPKCTFREVYALYDDESVIKGDGWIGEKFGEDVIEVMASRADIMLNRIKSGKPRVAWGVSPNGEHWRL